MRILVAQNVLALVLLYTFYRLASYSLSLTGTSGYLAVIGILISAYMSLLFGHIIYFSFLILKKLKTR